MCSLWALHNASALPTYFALSVSEIQSIWAHAGILQPFSFQVLPICMILKSPINTCLVSLLPNPLQKEGSGFILDSHFICSKKKKIRHWLPALQQGVTPPGCGKGDQKGKEDCKTCLGMVRGRTGLVPALVELRRQRELAQKVEEGKGPVWLSAAQRQVQRGLWCPAKKICDRNGERKTEILFMPWVLRSFSTSSHVAETVQYKNCNNMKTSTVK